MRKLLLLAIVSAVVGFSFAGCGKLKIANLEVCRSVPDQGGFFCIRKNAPPYIKPYADSKGDTCVSIKVGQALMQKFGVTEEQIVEENELVTE